MQINIKLTGPALTDPKRRIEAGTAKALDQTATYAKQILRSKTPVRTGAMKAGWKVEKSGQDSLRVLNPVKYSYWVDRRLGIVESAEDQIATYLSDRLGEEVTEQLG